MPPRGPGRTGHRWRQLCAQVYAEETHCWLCGTWVSQLLDPTHPMSRTVDHVRELWQGGDPLDRNNCRLAHRACNSRKSNRLRTHAPRDEIMIDPATL
ncbi:HNH endonuclease [Amycolatopsis suaedae]|uniref:HNH endonuclease n=1 Tax=Amycolatopsis suaedae TaxID=2510978 RepID=A0A4Q7IZC9_9PSEU|nr:HNH endonuclease [Amycolatopsis suaedae]RZQ59827.1 HNH endonuclease [Amycolatopsis suaedae]